MCFLFARQLLWRHVTILFPIRTFRKPLKILQDHLVIAVAGYVRKNIENFSSRKTSLQCPTGGQRLEIVVITGAQLCWGTGLKMQTVSFFQRYIVRDISLT